MELFHSVTSNLPIFRASREQVVFANHGIVSPSIQHFEVKKYNKKKSPIDKHPLLGIIKRKERQLLLSLLPGNGNIKSLSEKLNATHDEVVFLISHLGTECGSISLNNITLANFGIPTSHTVFKIESNSYALSHLKEAEKTELMHALSTIDNAFQEQFPHISPTNNFGYTEAHDLANKNLPTHNLFTRYPTLYQLGQIVVLVFIGWIFLYLPINRHSYKPIHRIITRRNNTHE